MTRRARRSRVGATTSVVLVALVALLCTVVLVGTGCGGGTAPAGRGFRARTTDGGRVTTASLRGHGALLTSWATWCTECAELLPGLQDIWTDLRTSGLQVVAVNVDRAGEAGAVAAEETGYRMTMPRWRDPDDTFTHAFRARGVPTSVLLDARGDLVRTWPGGVPVDDPAVRRLLKRSA